MHNYDTKFEIKPNKFVFIQSAEAEVRGRILIRLIRAKYAPHQIFFHFKRAGGHIAALRLHKNSLRFSFFDIENFFGQITRSKICRSLKELGFSSREAFFHAVESVVDFSGRKFLPFGFCQSPLVATLVLEKSLLGKFLIELYNEGINVSVYMDDIILSSNDKYKLIDASIKFLKISQESGFLISENKKIVNSEKLDAFNCIIKKGIMSIEENRMDEFYSQYLEASDFGRKAIKKYIEAVSANELIAFEKGLKLRGL